MISISKLSEILEKISHDYDIDINIDVLKKNFPELDNTDKKSLEIINDSRCLALMSNGERCTRKFKCKNNGLCGIHLNMLEKNGNLPNGKFDNNKNVAIGQSSIVTTSELSNSKKSKTSKMNNSGKSKIDKDVETEDSEEDEMDIKKSSTKVSNIKNNLSKKKNSKEKVKTNEDSEPEDIESICNEQHGEEEEIKEEIKKKLEIVVEDLVNKSNYNKCKGFNRNVEKKLFSNMESKYLGDSKLIKQLIKSSLENKFIYYDNLAKEEMMLESNKSSSDEEEIECIKIEKNKNFYLLDEKTSIVYNITSPHSEVGKIEKGTLVYFD